MRAVVERQIAAGRSADSAPPIRIVLPSDDSDFAIRLSDEGGGIARRDMNRIYSYLFHHHRTIGCGQVSGVGRG